MKVVVSFRQIRDFASVDLACEQALKVKWEPASTTNEFEYLPRNVRFSKYGMSILIWCCVQLSCKLNLDRAN
jgi:hypothetical protein